MSFQPIVPAIITRSPFLQEAIPALSTHSKPIVVAQLTGTWKDPKDTAAIEAVALTLINDLDIAARKNDMQTGYIFLNYAHAGQNVFSERRRRDWLQEVSRRYDSEGILQRCVPGCYKLY